MALQREAHCFTPEHVLALETDGYADVTLPAATRAAVADVYRAGLAFFRLSSERKLRDSLPASEFGYRPVGVEYSQSPQRPDPFESFSASIRTVELAGCLRSEEARLLQRRMVAVIEPFEEIADRLLSTIAGTLGGSPPQIGGGCRRWSSLQLNYSRPGTVTTAFIHEAHEDGHALTLAMATGPGLELQRPDGTFAPVESSARRMIVMPGEILTLLSGGRIRPLYHRVVPRHDMDERMALLFFADPPPVACAPWVSTAANAGVDIAQRVLTNAERYGLSGFPRE
ncbi:MAG TPA: 2OG-Fe(II) oxygenase family protein [Thermoanaerobaculia bacterium]|jgi:isopenicillin N synthase-like dioxygenase|nr:2OG-Fe(II) oxygenase family protein [Thermoanaerobaculia bacterium]